MQPEKCEFKLLRNGSLVFLNTFNVSSLFLMYIHLTISAMFLLRGGLCLIRGVISFNLITAS